VGTVTVLNWLQDDQNEPKQPSPVTKRTTPLALVFTDMVGSSAAKRAASLGSDASARDRAYLEGIQSKHLRLIRTTVAEHNGQEIMTIGDSFFLTFEEVSDAVRCAAAIQQRLRAFPIDTPSGPLQLRIGIHVGTPEFFENSWHGTDVDMAARVESAGVGQQILLSDAARAAAGEMSGITFRPLGTYVLKGVGEVKLWDCDYDNNGQRDSHLVSVEATRKTQFFARSLAAVAMLIVVCLGGFFFWQRYKDKQEAAEEKNKVVLSKDSIILADLANKTGDPVFDTTLTQAIAIQLEQSPVLNLISQQHLRQSLQYMGRPETDKITPEIAREIGQREGIKAYLSGDVVKLGNSYVITLSAQNTNNGDNIASEQAQAPDKDHVLEAVGKVSAQMRAHLGESLASIEKLDTPFGQATTASLEAFRAYALGDVEHEKGLDLPQAEGHYKQAIELDPNFAMAWARLAVVYSNSGQHGRALPAFTKAFELSKNVSERERLYIQAHYYNNATGDLAKAVDTLELSVKTYPLDLSAPINLGVAQGALGELEASLNSNLKAAQIDPSDSVAQSNILGAYVGLDRFQDAEKTWAEIQRLQIADGTEVLQGVYQLYFLEGNTAGMAQVLAKGEGRADQYLLTASAAFSQEFSGRYRAAENSWNETVRQAGAQKATDAEASNLLYLVSGRAIAGFCEDAPKSVHAALGFDKSKPTLMQVAFTAALCNDHADADPILAKLGRDYPEDTIIQKVVIPQSRAAMAIADHQPAVAIQELEGSKSFDLVSDGAYLRGLAYLELKDAANAIDAFQRATQYKGACLTLLQDYGQGRLGLARAYVMSGDKASAKKTYEDLLTLWKDADPDLPQLLAAKQEYAALK
jgi:class 3 adenylate cyclase/tetratricopeptide (TPR) repeat protein